MGDVDVAALLVIIAAVVAAPTDGGPLLGIGSHEVDVGVGVDFGLLKAGQLGPVQSHGLFWREGATQLGRVPAIGNSLRASVVIGAFSGFGAVIKQKRLQVVSKQSWSKCDTFFSPPCLSYLSAL